MARMKDSNRKMMARASDGELTSLWLLANDGWFRMGDALDAEGEIALAWGMRWKQIPRGGLRRQLQVDLLNRILPHLPTEGLRLEAHADLVQIQAEMRTADGARLP